jgi:hypothetical protein
MEIVLQNHCDLLFPDGLFKVVFGQQNEGSNPFTRNKLIQFDDYRGLKNQSFIMIADSSRNLKFRFSEKAAKI